MRGFTAIEMMIVVVIVAILTAIAVPNMLAMIRNQRIKTAAFDMFASLNFARSEAVKRNSAVTLTPTDAADWVKGWTITDANGNVLRTEGNRRGTTINTLSVAELTVVGPATVVFARSGRLGGAAGTFNFSATSTAMTRCITVELSGRPITC